MEDTTRSAVSVRGRSRSVCPDVTAPPRPVGSSPVSWRYTGQRRSLSARDMVPPVRSGGGLVRYGVFGVDGARVRGALSARARLVRVGHVRGGLGPGILRHGAGVPPVL